MSNIRKDAVVEIRVTMPLGDTTERAAWNVVQSTPPGTTRTEQEG